MDTCLAAIRQSVRHVHYANERETRGYWVDSSIFRSTQNSVQFFNTLNYRPGFLGQTTHFELSFKSTTPPQGAGYEVRTSVNRSRQAAGNSTRRDSIMQAPLDLAIGRGGPGYRNRVTNRNQVWFGDELRQSLEKQLRTLIEKEWTQILGRVTALFESDR